MRLRLRIERNALPPTQALWPVKDNKCTIAQLLEQINKTFPLEADTWGLEDYSVSVGGYDCLHYHELDAVCRDEDELVIRPLQYIDVRSRTLNGRNQIAADGRHLVDGIPFGRPALRDPVRPGVSIPPRKKRKLSEDVVGEGSDGGGPLMLTENGDELDDEEDDDEYEVSETDELSPESSSLGEDESSSEGSSDSSTEEESSPSDSEDTSDDESDNPEPWTGISESEPSTPSRKKEKSASANSTGAEQVSVQAVASQTGTKRKRGVERESPSLLESIHNEPSIQNEEIHKTREHDTGNSKSTGLPFEGKSVTKARNARRREVKKLTYLKLIGELPEDATLEFMRQHQMIRRLQADTQLKQTSLPADSTDDPLEQDISRHRQGSVSETTEIVSAGKKRKKAKQAEQGAENGDNLEQKRQKLLAAIASGGVDVTSTLDADVDPPEQLSSKVELPAESSLDREGDTQPPPNKASAMLAKPTTPRTKLDLAGSQRLVFGSLGVRVPKTQEDRDALQAKLAARPSRNIHSEQVDVSELNGTMAAEAGGQESQAENEANKDVEWRQKIRLTAVECCDEGVTLSAPPFPFHQRWDPQYRKKKQKANKRVNGKYMENTGKGRKSQMHNFVETYDKYNINGDGDALNYDDPEEDDEYWEEGALLNGEYDDDDEEEDAPSNGYGFPILPSNIDALPIVTEAEVKTGDFITFEELACDESTQWQPITVARTAQVQSPPQVSEIDADVDSNMKYCTIQLSNRDFQQKVFDEDGNRIYSKFEMPGNDAEDDGKRELQWKDLGVVRLVLRPE